MQLHVLGSSGTSPSAGNPASGYLITSGSSAVLLDAGPGVAMALLGVMPPQELDAVFLSHRHPDHCSDLFAIFHHLAYGPGAGRGPLPVISPADVWGAMTAFVGSSDAWRDVFDWREAVARTRIGELELEFGASSHSVPASCVRVSDGKTSVTYSGDTGPGGDLAELAMGTGTLLCEATYQDATEADYPFHLTARQAGVLARAGGVGRLILTHLPPTLDSEISIEEAASEFEGETLVAAPGMVIQI